uniref:Uncharacterized protein n=1 Tax=Glossina palpalis gambiensis TaxID=67801 RepID=A0A1B0C667_9MUSC
MRRSLRWRLHEVCIVLLFFFFLDYARVVLYKCDHSRGEEENRSIYSKNICRIFCQNRILSIHYNLTTHKIFLVFDYTMLQGVSAHSTVDDDLLFSRDPEAVKLPFDAEFALLLLLDGLHDDIGFTKKKELCGEGMLAADPFASDSVAEELAPKFKACKRFNSS